MLTVRQAAERAGVCQRIVRGWVKDGRVPCYRLRATGRRGKIAIAEADLDAFLAGLKVVSGPAPGLAPPPAPPRQAFKHLTLK